MNTITLYRPVGQKELELTAATGFRAFPPRLPEQPIFYPVLSREYAEQIARDWNTRDERSGFAGHVLEFDVDAEYLSHFDVKRVGSHAHLEYWIPAEELEEFNLHIHGPIRLVISFPDDARTMPPWNGFLSCHDLVDSHPDVAILNSPHHSTGR